MKIMRTVFCLMMVLLMAVGMIGAGQAESVGGSTGSTTTFSVRADSSDAYINLYSSKGNARITQNGQTMNLIETETEERNHGFYSISVKSGGYSKKYDWAPSAGNLFILGRTPIVRERGTVTDANLRIELPFAGTFTITVSPHSASEINKYWSMDQFHNWISNATWKVDKEYHCSCSYSASPTAREESHRVMVYCYEQGTMALLKSYEQRIDKDTDFYAPAISGYSCDQVQFVRYIPGGSSQIGFYYDRNDTGSNNRRNKGNDSNNDRNQHNNSTAVPTQQPSVTTPPARIQQNSSAPYIGNTVYGLDARNDTVYWVQRKLKATGVYYQGDSWKVTGHLGKHTLSEIRRFMRDRGYSNHSGVIDQNVINELSKY